MFDGIEIIKRVSDRGALIKVLDKTAPGSHHTDWARVRGLPQRPRRGRAHADQGPL
jgi:hypothetical protein